MSPAVEANLAWVLWDLMHLFACLDPTTHECLQ